jgi:hypothetical protein
MTSPYAPKPAGKHKNAMGKHVMQGHSVDTTRPPTRDFDLQQNRRFGGVQMGTQGFGVPKEPLHIPSPASRAFYDIDRYAHIHKHTHNTHTHTHTHT